MTDTTPTTKTCATCRNDYDTNVPNEVKLHTEPFNCESCSRCRHKPRCYVCFSSFCFCTAH